MPIEKITSFFDFEEWLKRKQQHTEELETENIDLTRENFRLKREIRELKVERAKFVNQIIALKKSPVTAEDELENIYNISIPEIFKGREVK